MASGTHTTSSSSSSTRIIARKFHVGWHRELPCGHAALECGKRLTLCLNRIRPISGLPPRADDFDRRRNHLTLYVALFSSQLFACLTDRLILALLLAGCSSSSPLIPGIFLLSIYYKGYEAHPDTAQVDYSFYGALKSFAGNAQLQARVGYFGICVNPDGGSWLCSNNATALAKEVSVDQDPLNLIWLAAQFKDMIVFPYLM